MNRPKRGSAPIIKPTNKKFNTLRKMIQKVKGKKKKKSSKRTKHKRNWDLEIPQLNHPIFIYCEESKTGRKGDREADVK